MLGKMSSLQQLVELLRISSVCSSLDCWCCFDADQIDNYVITELQQSHTRRWILAWSLQGHRLSEVCDPLTPSSWAADPVVVSREVEHPSNCKTVAIIRNTEMLCTSWLSKRFTSCDATRNKPNRTLDLRRTHFRGVLHVNVLDPRCAETKSAHRGI